MDIELTLRSIYLTGETIFSVIGQEHSLANPKIYAHLVWIELIGIALQLLGVGFAMLSSSTDAGLGPGADKGGYVVAAGMGLHAVSLISFFVFFAAGLIHASVTYRKFGYTSFNPKSEYEVSSRRFKIFLMIVFIAVLCLIARVLYRIVGLARGFDEGSRNQGLFAVFDGLMVAEVVLGFAVSNPAYVFRDSGQAETRSPMKTAAVYSYGRQEASQEARQAVV
jgi:hypothetical protein